MKIRPEQEAEYPVIYELVKEAFASAPHADGDEQDYVNLLRSSKNYIPELALVAEENGELIGHIMFTTTKIIGGEDSYTELLLSPLCVLLPHRNRGIGAELVQEGFRRAKNIGYSAAFVVGDPKYYSRFGYKVVSEFGIRNDSEIPDMYVMGCELFPGALKNKQGSIRIV